MSDSIHWSRFMNDSTSITTTDNTSLVNAQLALGDAQQMHLRYDPWQQGQGYGQGYGYAGHTCSRCGTWVSSYQYHECCQYYPPVQTNFITVPATTKDPDLTRQMERIADVLEKLLDKFQIDEDPTHNVHEEVRGHDGKGSPDQAPNSRGSRGADWDEFVTIVRKLDLASIDAE